jgi:RNA polymerase sigma factor (sigma-70 family)
MTRYTLIDLVRARKNLTRYVPDETPEPTADEDPHQLMVDEEKRFLFYRILSTIDKKCRELWQMIFDKELPYQEIAKSLDISVNTLKQRVFRCKEEAVALKAKLPR